MAMYCQFLKLKRFLKTGSPKALQRTQTLQLSTLSLTRVIIHKRTPRKKFTPRSMCPYRRLNTKTLLESIPTTWKHQTKENILWSSMTRVDLCQDSLGMLYRRLRGRSPTSFTQRGRSQSLKISSWFTSRVHVMESSALTRLASWTSAIVPETGEARASKDASMLSSKGSLQSLDLWQSCSWQMVRVEETWALSKNFWLSRKLS